MDGQIFRMVYPYESLGRFQQGIKPRGQQRRDQNSHYKSREGSNGGNSHHDHSAFLTSTPRLSPRRWMSQALKLLSWTFLFCMSMFLR